MSLTETDVLIIGAGSTGLLLAQGLKTAGIGFQIFERRAEGLARREWSMSLHWGAEFLAKTLPPEVYAHQQGINTDPRYDNSNDEGFIQCNGETAEPILVMKGSLPRRVSRQKLNNLLREGIDVNFNKGLDRFEMDESREMVVAHFEDGSQISAKIIIGCDGSRSKVRESIIGDKELSENIPQPYTMFNFPAQYTAAISESIRDIHPTFKAGYHPKQNTFCMLAMADAASTDPTDWKHQSLISWRGPPTVSDLDTQEKKLARLHEIGKEWAHPFSTAMLNVSPDTELFMDPTSEWDPRQHHQSKDGQSLWNGHNWHGRATLAGDAAHTMLPFRGQGLNNALEDAAELLTALTAVFKDKSETLDKAISAYEAVMVARGGLEVEVSSKQTVAAHNWDLLMQSPIFKHGAHKTQAAAATT